ncbi:MAG TPA: DUF6599 family protein [Bryobacteraceae bacterium]|nr:DUF6599 family protein [Bryobacteraceae bacterium]
MKSFIFLSVPALLLFPAAALPAMFPETAGHWKLSATAAAKIPDLKVWQEYGLRDSQMATYADAGADGWTISGYRFDEATGAMAAFDAARPADAKPVKLDEMGVPNAAGNASEELVAAGNYLFVIDGYKPTPEELNHFFGTVPRYSRSPLPTLPKYMPAGIEANSERYIVGPESLARYLPRVPVSTAAFHFNAEAEIAKYGRPGAETTLVIFNYPTMEMARDRYPHFQQVSGAMAKRTGPMVAVALDPVTPDAAEKLLARVKYEADVTVSQHVPTLKDNPANLFWNIMILCGILAAFCIVSGFVVGGLRLLIRRAGADGEGDAMISLHLSGHN